MPYFEIVERVRKDDTASDAEYLKTLINEIFDNPVERIYKKHKDEDGEVTLPSKEIVDLIKKALTKSE